MALHLLLLNVIVSIGPFGPGTTAFPLLKVPVGARACAMGEAFTGLADDAHALYWNPAGLGRMNLVQFGLSHQEWFAGTRDENLTVSLPLGPGTLGIGAVYSATGGIETWDPENEAAGSATLSSGYAALGYGLNVGKALACGLVLKGLYDQLVTVTGYGGCADLGVLYRPNRAIGLGLSVQNLGPNMRYGSSGYMLPALLNLGASLTWQRFSVLLDADVPIDNNPTAHLGGEYRVNRFLALRAGAKLGPQDFSNLDWTSLLTAGAGLSLDRFLLDYALVPYGELGLTHRLALRLNMTSTLYGRARLTAVEFGTGNPLPARFTLYGTQQGRSLADEKGRCVAEGIEPGWLAVNVTAEGYAPQTESAYVEARATQDMRFVLRKTGFGSFWAAVNDADSRRALPALVRYSGPVADSVQNDSFGGSLALKQLPAGDYVFTAAALDNFHAVETLAVTIEAGKLSSHTFLLARATTAVRPDSSSAVPVQQDSSSATPAQPEDWLPLDETPLPEDQTPPQVEPAPAPEPGN